MVLIVDCMEKGGVLGDRSDCYDVLEVMGDGENQLSFLPFLSVSV